MAKLSISVKALTIELSFAEKILGLHGNLTIPLSSISGASQLDKTWVRTLGLRVPGTGIPGLVIAGRFVSSQNKSWVTWTRGNQVLQIDLKDQNYTRILVGLPDAEAAAAQINALI
jgi:hypothetical protein